MPSAGTSAGKQRQRRGSRLISGDLSQTFVCTCCTEVKLVSEFRTRKRKAGKKCGTSHCRECWLKWRKMYREDNSTVSRQLYSLENLRRSMKKVGLTELDYFKKLEEQQGGCAICGGLPGGRGRFHVDHDHASGVFRGLLCHRHNTALGLFGDDVDLLMQAVAYLLQHNQIFEDSKSPSRGGKYHS
jgi:hypothetical protein